MTDPSQLRAWATIDLAALQKNLAHIDSLTEAGIVAVIKANGYGHGMAAVAHAIKAATTKVACLAVATVDEALALKQLDTGMGVLLLQGFANAEECQLLVAKGIEMVIHTPEQVTVLHKELSAVASGSNMPVLVDRIWIKLDTGMHRLGMTPPECLAAFQQLSQCPGIGQLILMSHLACADNVHERISKAANENQLAELDATLAALQKAGLNRPEVSVSASAGMVNLPETHHQYVRPGIMLYGGSAIHRVYGNEMGLLPVMTLSSRIIAIKTCLAGEAVGYGGSYVCETDVRMGVVSIGYGDGYPRSAADCSGPVLIKAASGNKRVRLIGRVSMDMLSIDISDVADAKVGDEVVLWGEGLPADEIAAYAGTISYELFCNVMPRVSKIYR